MEDFYILHNDCVQDLSGLFSIISLMSLSTTTKSYQYFIFELKYCNKKLYYSNIWKFRNLLTLSVPKDFIYDNLSHLTQLKTIQYRNMDCKQYITSLTNLISCQYIDFDGDVYDEFHTKLISLERLNDEDEHSMKNILLFTNLKLIDTRSIADYRNASQLLIYTNLTNLYAIYTDDISVLSQITNLQEFETKNKGYALQNFYFSHGNITQLEISKFNECVLEHCYQLKKLTVKSCKKLIINNCKQINEIIIRGYPSHLDYDFDIEPFPDVEHLSFDNKYSLNILRSNLTRLNDLTWACCENPIFNHAIANNITSLIISSIANTFDFEYFTNLKILRSINVTIINLNRVTKLEKLTIHGSDDKSIFIDSRYHRNLTYLEVNRCLLGSLSRLQKLEILKCTRLSNDFIIFFDTIKYLPRLKLLKLIFSSNLYHDYIVDISSWLSLNTIEEFNVGITVNDLSLLKNLKHLSLEYHNEKDNNKCVSKLTNLTFLFLVIYIDNVVIDLRNLTRLERLNYHAWDDVHKETLNIIQPANYRGV